MFHDFTDPKFCFSHRLPTLIPVVVRQPARRLDPRIADPNHELIRVGIEAGIR